MTQMPSVGSEISSYRLEEVIGRGGMSVVYLARHLRLGSLVAVKMLPPHLAEDEQFRQRFMRESLHAAALNHPSIINVFDAGEANGVLCIAMPYIKGKIYATSSSRRASWIHAGLSSSWPRSPTHWTRRTARGWCIGT
jgi:serine/threonine protein kinase